MKDTIFPLSYSITYIICIYLQEVSKLQLKSAKQKEKFRQAWQKHFFSSISHMSRFTFKMSQASMDDTLGHPSNIKLGELQWIEGPQPRSIGYPFTVYGCLPGHVETVRIGTVAVFVPPSRLVELRTVICGRVIVLIPCCEHHVVYWHYSPCESPLQK